MEDLQMEARLEDKEIAQDINNQRDFYLTNMIPLDRDFYEILENNSHTNVKNIFLEIQGDYNNQFPTAFQQEVVQIEGINYLVHLLIRNMAFGKKQQRAIFKKI